MPAASPTRSAHTSEHLVPNELAGVLARGGGGAAVSNQSIVRNRLGWFMECFRGLPCPSSTHSPPPEERKIIFRIVNFKHEKAVFNLAETGLNLHFVNICVLQRKAEHACAHRQAYTQIHTCPCSGIPAYMCLLIYS